MLEKELDRHQRANNGFHSLVSTCRAQLQRAVRAGPRQRGLAGDGKGRGRNVSYRMSTTKRVAAVVDDCTK